MTDEEKIEYVKYHYLADAIYNIEECGRYWNASISRTMRGALEQTLYSSGYEVTVLELPPDWEHVFTLDGLKNSDLIEKIALIRSIEREKGINEYFMTK